MACEAGIVRVRHIRVPFGGSRVKAAGGEGSAGTRLAHEGGSGAAPGSPRQDDETQPQGDRWGRRGATLDRFPRGDECPRVRAPECRGRATGSWCAGRDRRPAFAASNGERISASCTCATVICIGKIHATTAARSVSPRVDETRLRRFGDGTGGGHDGPTDPAGSRNGSEGLITCRADRLHARPVPSGCFRTCTET